MSQKVFLFLSSTAHVGRIWSCLFQCYPDINRSITPHILLTFVTISFSYLYITIPTPFRHGSFATLRSNFRPPPKFFVLPPYLLCFMHTLQLPPFLHVIILFTQNVQTTLSLISCTYLDNSSIFVSQLDIVFLIMSSLLTPDTLSPFSSRQLITCMLPV